MSNREYTALYELVILIKPDLSDNAVEEIARKISNIITERKDKIVKKENWGLRKTSYIIKKNNKAHYRYFIIESSRDLLVELNTTLGRSEQILKHMFIKIKKVPEHSSPLMMRDESSTVGYNTVIRKNTVNTAVQSK